MHRTMLSGTLGLTMQYILKAIEYSMAFHLILDMFVIGGRSSTLGHIGVSQVVGRGLMALSIADLIKVVLVLLAAWDSP